MRNKEYDSKKFMTIQECLDVSGYYNSYFRMKILKPGLVKSHKELIPGTQIPRTLVDRESFEAYLKNHPKTTRFVLTNEMKKVLKENGFDI